MDESERHSIEVAIANLSNERIVSLLEDASIAIEATQKGIGFMVQSLNQISNLTFPP